MGQHKKLATFSPDYRITIDYEVKIIQMGVPGKWQRHTCPYQTWVRFPPLPPLEKIHKHCRTDEIANHQLSPTKKRSR